MLKIYFFLSTFFLMSSVAFADIDNNTQTLDNSSVTDNASISKEVIADILHDAVKSSLDGAYKLYYANEFVKAIESFEVAFDKSNDDKFKLNMASYIALSYRGLKDYEKSNKWFQIAYRFAVRLDDKDSIATLLAQIAENHKLLKKYPDAIKFYEQALASEQIDNKTEATLLYGLAMTHLLSSNLEMALKVCADAQVISIEEKLELITLNCDLIKAESLKADEDYSASLQIYRTTYDKAVARAYVDITIKSLVGLGKIYEKLSRFSAARDKYEEAIFVSLNNKIYDDVAFASSRISELLFFTELKNSKIADKLYDISLTLDNGSDGFLKSRISTLAADYYSYSSKANKALNILKLNYDWAVKHDHNRSAVVILYSVARADRMMKNYASSLLKIDEALLRMKKEKIDSGNKLDKLYAFKSQLLYDLKRVSEAEQYVRLALDVTDDELASERYKDLLQTIQTRKTLDRNLLLTPPVAIDIDNITIGETPDETGEFTVNELITSDDPDIAIDDDEIIGNDNVTEDLDVIDLNEVIDNESDKL